MSTRASKKAPSPAATQDATPKPRLQERYEQEVAPALQKEFTYDNVMRTPALHKIVINIGMGEAIQNPKTMEAAERGLTTITGQHPVQTKAKRSVAAFKLREGMKIGVMVTLRGRRMYHRVEVLF